MSKLSRREFVALGVAAAGAPALARAFPALQPAARENPKAAEIARKAATFLFSKQDAATGGWAVNPQGPTFPAITGLIVNGLLLGEGYTINDKPVADAVRFILSKRQPDGGIYDKVLPSYNTAICLSALARVNTPEARAAIKPAQEFLRTLQYGEGAVVYEGMKDSAKPMAKDNPFYGGVGYGGSGRPDLSNTAFVLEALHDSGVESTDPAFQRAMVFLQRVQMLGTVNDMPYAKSSKQGGFIYSTSEGKDKIGTGQSYAGTIEETMDDGTKISRLRAYGSMSYAGFKSYLYAGLKRDDPRVTAAYEWIRRNYTLTENPNVGLDGMYYYYVTFARALHAWGDPKLNVISADGKATEHDWASDLVAQLASFQQPDGSFKTFKDRWMENDPVLVTAYSLLALRHAGA